MTNNWRGPNRSMLILFVFLGSLPITAVAMLLENDEVLPHGSNLLTIAFATSFFLLLVLTTTIEDGVSSEL